MKIPIKKTKKPSTRAKLGAGIKKEKIKKPKVKKTEKTLPQEKLPPKELKKPPLPVKPEKYLEAIGRRKTAIARIRIFTQGEKVFLVNEKPYNLYFPTLELQQITTASLEKMKCFDKFRILIRVKGGGIHSQAEAIRQGIARALILFNPDFRKRLKKAGYLKRDPRKKERKKFGLKRARRAPQWQKR